MKLLLNFQGRGWFKLTAIMLVVLSILALFVFSTRPVKVWQAEAVSVQEFESVKNVGLKRISLTEKQGPSMEVFAKVTPEIARVGEPRVVSLYVHNLSAPASLSINLEEAMTVAENASNWQLQPGQINQVKLTVTPFDDSVSLPLVHITIADGKSQINKTIHLKTAGRSQVAGQDTLSNTHPLGQISKDAQGQTIVLMSTETTAAQKLKALFSR